MKLGELFVDLGVNSGNALNSLTNFSIKFLAVKNAASQFADSVDALFGDTARFGQQLIKNNFITGQSVTWMQQMKYQAEQVGSSFEEVIGTIKHLQQMNADVLMGKGLPSAIQRLGVDVSRLREPTELLDEIVSKLLRLEPAFRSSLASELGISESVLFMYQQKTLEMDKQLLLTKEESAALNQLNKDWVHLQQSLGAWWDKKIAGMAGFFSGIINLVKLGLGIENPNPGRDKIPDGMSLTDFLAQEGKIPSEKPEDSEEPYEGLTGEDLADFIREDNPEVFDYNRSILGLPPSANVSYNDNSQTIINTSDGVAQHEQIANTMHDKRKRELSKLEINSRRQV